MRCLPYRWQGVLLSVTLITCVRRRGTLTNWNTSRTPSLTLTGACSDRPRAGFKAEVVDIKFSWSRGRTKNDCSGRGQGILYQEIKNYNIIPSIYTWKKVTLFHIFIAILIASHQPQKIVYTWYFENNFSLYQLQL